MKAKFSHLEKLLRETSDSYAIHKRTLATLESQRGIWADDYINQKINQEGQNLERIKQLTLEQVLGDIDELRSLAIKKRESMPALDSPKMSNALKVLELTNGRPTFEVGREISRQFAGDPLALQAIQSVYKAHGASTDYGVSELLYDVESAYRSLSEQAVGTFLQNGSLNGFAVSVSRVAEKEGVSFPKMIDESGANDVMRAAAGLAT